MKLEVTKSDVFDAVDKATAYIGAKDSDESAYDRVSTTNANREILEDFWKEACSGATEKFKRFVSFSSTGDKYEVDVWTGKQYNSALTSSINDSLFSYLVSMIVSKWLRYCNAGASESFANDAAGAMDDVMRKLYHKSAPVRSAPNNNNVSPEEDSSDSNVNLEDYSGTIDFGSGPKPGIGGAITD